MIAVVVRAVPPPANAEVDPGCDHAEESTGTCQKPRTTHEHGPIFARQRGAIVSEWFSDPLYRQVSDEQLLDPLPREPAMTMLPPPAPPASPRAAATAGEQDHSDPWLYAGSVTGPPVNP